MMWLRTLLFNIAFLVGSALIVLIVPVIALIGGERAMIPYAHFWARFGTGCARLFLGITYRVEGRQPGVPVLYAIKHQALYETMIFGPLLGGPAVVLKRELRRIPFWGYAAHRYGAIVADRDQSASALRAMMREAKARAASGRSVLIYPEGTRVQPGEQPALQSGFAGLYRAIGLPVVPIALNSGEFWPKYGSKRPGVITVRIGEIIPAGLKREEIEARVHAAINVLDHQPGPSRE